MPSKTSPFRTFVQFLLQVLVALPEIIYYIVETVIIRLIPRKYQTLKQLKGRSIFITGAGLGVGRQLAIKLSKLGARLVLVDINEEALNDTKKLLEPRSEVFLHKCDISKREKVYAVAKKAKEEVGKIDILINNAGIVVGKRLMDSPDDQMQRVFEVNAISHLWTCKAFLPDMIAANEGHIVAISSIVGTIGMGKAVDYCGSKFAVIGMMKALDSDLVEDGIDGIRLTTILPCHISSGLFAGVKSPSYLNVNPSEVAEDIIYAIQTERDMLFSPDYIHIGYLFERFLPRKAYWAFGNAIGITFPMRSFRGRDENHKSKYNKDSSEKNLNGNCVIEDSLLKRIINSTQ